jgi:uncharacterized protein (TIGR00255 family)
MTGFGRGTADQNSTQITALIKAVNGRFLEIRFRGLELDPEDEKLLREVITQELIRGTVFVTLDMNSNSGTQELSFNRERFEAIESILLDIQKEYGRHLDLGEILTTNDLFSYVKGNAAEPQLMVSAIKAACREVVEMRRAEGKKLQDDLDARLSLVEKALLTLEQGLPEELKNRQTQYRERIQALLGDVNLDESRVLQEAAFLAERGDVTEEVVRLKSHFLQFRNLLKEKDPVGRKLNFLLQEMGREINTIGAKCSSEKSIAQVIIMKDEAEKMREQIQNVL